ncbi:hypothetical protein HDU76_012635 [Blyttiomyces sp. JEL0837]|nr:hypothetical protein HDU76_012635 [Blyttiomyces sp. JEL0837]
MRTKVKCVQQPVPLVVSAEKAKGYVAPTPETSISKARSAWADIAADTTSKYDFIDTIAIAPSASPHSISRQSSWHDSLLFPGDKSQPRFLLLLVNHIRTEMVKLGIVGEPPGNLKRLQVYREAFDYFITEFRTYQYVLAEIKNEYECALNECQKTIDTLLPLRTQVSVSKYEAVRDIDAIKRDAQATIEYYMTQMKSLEGQKAELFSEISVLKNQLSGLADELRQREGAIQSEELTRRRLDEMREHAESLEKQLSDTIKAKDEEINELQLGLRKAHRDLYASIEEAKQLALRLTQTVSKSDYDALNQTKEAISLRVATQEREITELKSVTETLKKTLVEKEKLLKRAEADKFPNWEYIAFNCPGPIHEYGMMCRGMDFNDAITILVRQLIVLKAGSKAPPPTKEVMKEEAKIVGQQEPKFFIGLGLGSDVPKYLRYKGKIQNRKLSKKDCCLLIDDIWTAKIEYDASAKKGLRLQLGAFLFMYLKKKFGSQDAIAEWAYNLSEASKKHSFQSVDCQIFYSILTGRAAFLHVQMEIFSHSKKPLLGNMDEDVFGYMQNSIQQVKNLFHKHDIGINDGKPRGIVAKADCTQVLREMWPNKTVEEITQLVNALDADQPGDTISYAWLFQPHSESLFIEIVKEQELIGRDNYLNGLMAAMRAISKDQRFSSADILRALASHDPTKERKDLEAYMAKGFGIPIHQLKARSMFTAKFFQLKSQKQSMPPKRVKEVIPTTLPIIPTRNQRVLLPGIVMRLQIGRKDTTYLMDQLYSQYSKSSNIMVACVPMKVPLPPLTNPNGTAILTPPKKPDQEEKAPPPVAASDLHDWGVAARIINFVKPSANEAKQSRTSYIITLEGVSRIKIDGITRTNPYFEASITVFEEKGMYAFKVYCKRSSKCKASPEIDKDDTELAALIINLRATGHELASVLSQLQLPPSVLNQLKQMLDSTPPGHLADLFASMIDLSFEEKLQTLELTDVKTRIARTLELLTRQVQVLKISQKLQTTVENKLGQKQREFILRQQLDAIKKELGESEEVEEDDLADLTKRIGEAKLSDEAAKAAQRELRRLKKMHSSLAEYQVIRTYLEWLAEVPWAQSTEDVMDIAKAREQLNEDHYGLEKVKTRVLEFLAVRKLKADLKGPILCFLGPPGVGKTSLGRSIAAALGRKFYRISLGGVRDEAEIRGHRRTYIGALPGLIIQGLRRCGVNNPVFLLDEIDKLGRDFRGDPSSALLEVLDPEQNSTFSDHYLNVPYDLSNVLFIATANDAETIPSPLMDRMEVIRIPGYTFDEKMHIAKRYLLPKQINVHGLPNNAVQISDKVLFKVATGYTREAGVRGLEREIAGRCRALAVEYADAKEKNAITQFDGVVTEAKVETVLGQEKFDDEVSERTSIPGVATGLAWTASGSGGLLFIEATQMPGKGNLVLTGKLGDVIKESAQLGLTWVRANASKLGLVKTGLNGVSGNLLDNVDVHIHFPAGATPKDGPSAGITIVTALVSLFLGVPVREHLAMTGEMTLRGLVQPVGGIKEKVLAAHRGGVKRIILPIRNKKDIADVPENVVNEIEFHFVRSAEEVLQIAFNNAIFPKKVSSSASTLSTDMPAYGIAKL